LNDQLEQDYAKPLETLLQAPDPLVRIFAAKALGDLRVSNALTALTAALSEENETVRVQVIRAVGRIGTPKVLEVLMALAVDDPSLKCRREAVRSLGVLARNTNGSDTVSHEKIKKALLQAIQEKDEAARSFAALGLQCCADDPAVRKVLTRALRDESIYVKRMAAKALILSGVKKGIPALIDTLKFRSIDTFEHYDNEIAKDLAYYTGIDFPEKQRYSHTTWHDWWRQHGRSVDLNHNLEIMRAIERAFEAPSADEGIVVFERLMEENPQSMVVRRRYTRFCNDWINFRLLTRQTITPEVLKTCLQLQAKITLLEPERAAGWERLAHFLARLSRHEDAIVALQKAIDLQPENKDLQKTLLTYRQTVTAE
jgi:tetratricopeptide (TPR) repeat protein